MAKIITMPKSGITVETCVMGEWKKKPGEAVREGECIFSYETDKSSFEYLAQEEDTGILLASLVEEGADVPVLQPVCVVGSVGEDISSLINITPQAAAEESAAQREPAAGPEPAPGAEKESSGQDKDRGFRISPRARKLAARMDISDVATIIGTGPMGRIIERDVRAYAVSEEKRTERASASAEKPLSEEKRIPAPADDLYEERKLSNIRKVIARNMQQSLSGMAQLTHTTSYDATAVLSYRRRLKTAPAELGLPDITINDILIYAVSRTLARCPELNAHLEDDTLRLFKHANIGIAVDTPRGLMVPTVMKADCKSLSEIAAESKQLAAACQKGNIDPGLLSGASFTVTNLGSFGIESFTPIINPPQTGILGVNCITDRPRRGENGIELYPAMGLSLTYDHRALDGAPASRFLQDLCRTLEHFDVLLAL